MLLVTTYYSFAHNCFLFFSCGIKKGVHYPDDNIAGLNLAQEVLARALPQLLRDKYNANPFNVARKIRQNRFDWRNFDPKNPCPNIRR